MFSVVPGTDEENDGIHPTTLDSIVQSFYVDVLAEMKERAQVVPRSIGSMFVVSRPQATRRGTRSTPSSSRFKPTNAEHALKPLLSMVLTSQPGIW